MEKIELSLFRDDMFVSVENPKQSTKKETWNLKVTIIYNSILKHEILSDAFNKTRAKHLQWKLKPINKRT